MLPALPTLVVLALAATASAPDTPAPGTALECPTPAQLAAALNALAPGLAPAAPKTMPLPLASGARLGVATSPEGDVRVDLVDGQGEIVLHRVLPAPPRGRAPDCAALAETIALIVDRYLHDVGYEAPPLPPPAPPPAPPPPQETPPEQVTATPTTPTAVAPRTLWRLGVAAVARRGDAGGFDGDGNLALGVEGTGDDGRRRPHWGARLSLGYAPASEARWADKTATLRRLPCRVGVFLGFPLGPGHLEPGVGAGVDLLLVSVDGPGAEGGTHVSPAGDLAVGYTVPLSGPVYGRVLSRAALAVPYTFKALEVAQVWGTPRVYLEVGVEFGFAFR